MSKSRLTEIMIFIVLLVFVGYFFYHHGRKKEDLWIQQQQEIIDSLRARGASLEGMIQTYNDSVYNVSLALVATKDTLEFLKKRIVYERKRYEDKIKDISNFSSDSIYVLVTEWLDTR